MAFPWPDAEKPMMFYSQLGIEEISVSGTSFLNRTGVASVPCACAMRTPMGGYVTYRGQAPQVASPVAVMPIAMTL